MKNGVSNESVQQCHTFCMYRMCCRYDQRPTQINGLDTSQKNTASSLQGILDMAVGEQCDCVHFLANDKETRFLTATESLSIVL